MGLEQDVTRAAQGGGLSPFKFRDAMRKPHFVDNKSGN